MGLGPIKIGVLITAIGLALLLAACAGDDDENGTGEEESPTADATEASGAGESDCLITQEEASTILGGNANPAELGAAPPPGGDVTSCAFEGPDGEGLSVSSFPGVDEAYYEQNVKTFLGDPTEPVEGIGAVADYGISGDGAFRAAFLGFLQGETAVTISCIDCGSDARYKEVTTEAAHVVVGKL